MRYELFSFQSFGPTKSVVMADRLPPILDQVDNAVEFIVDTVASTLMHDHDIDSGCNYSTTTNSSTTNNSTTNNSTHTTMWREPHHLFQWNTADSQLAPTVPCQHWLWVAGKVAQLTFASTFGIAESSPCNGDCVEIQTNEGVPSSGSVLWQQYSTIYHQLHQQGQGGVPWCDFQHLSQGIQALLWICGPSRYVKQSHKAEPIF